MQPHRPVAALLRQSERIDQSNQLALASTRECPSCKWTVMNAGPPSMDLHTNLQGFHDLPLDHQWGCRLRTDMDNLRRPSEVTQLDIR